jgi:ATP-binding cassette subfamily B protein
VTGPALVYGYGGSLVLGNALSLGTVVAFAALLTNLYRPMHQLATVYVDIQASLAVFERIFEYLDLVPEVEDRPSATVIGSALGHIAFDRVGFSYPAEPAANGRTDDVPFALDDVTFEIRPGQHVALVGPSGAGKTTITYLLPRLYDPDSGSIALDGHDLRSLTQESLRKHIGVVTQETFLFHDTVRGNLLYARPDATIDEIVRAAEAAHIHKLIEGLPAGYDTVVGERGFRLSGGEKQRVAIARALLKDPRILVLDEATSSLDSNSEYLIQQALETLLRGRTALIIAHRLSTILSSDNILVLSEGRIVDQGRHEDLLARGGLYAELFRQQFAKVLKA